MTGFLRMAADQKDYNAADVKFVRKMIPHHEMAVGMANAILARGENKEVLALAKSIKAAQESEIKTMKKWLKDRDLEEDERHAM